MNDPLDWIKRRATLWLRQGISPRRLALTLALGFAIGCVPVVGIPTVICAALALALRLNFPAIQAANYAAMPLQLLLMVPFVRLGGRLFDVASIRAEGAGALLHTPPAAVVSQLTGVLGHALLAWLLIAVPAVILLTPVLTVLLRHVSVVAAAEACGD